MDEVSETLRSVQNLKASTQSFAEIRSSMDANG